LRDGPPIAHALVKAAFARGLHHARGDFQAEKDYLAPDFATRGHAEGIAAFKEKRKPVFDSS
jgi:enoyl-CoA hydratase/carnithine racemase